MRPITVQVGPLGTASATNISTASRLYGTGAAVALNGTLANKVSGTICATQGPAAAAFLLNGTNAVGSIAVAGNQYLYFVFTGDSHTRTLAVVGTDINGAAITETVTCANAQSVASVKKYMNVVSITPSGAITGNVTVGTFTLATTDVARQVLITTTTSESGATVLLSGTDWAGSPISETIALPASATTVASVLSYLTVTSAIVSAATAGNLSFGTNGIADSQWVRFDDWAGGSTSIQCNVFGTVNYTVSFTNDDPNSPTGTAIAPSAVTWSSALSPFIAATTTNQAIMDAPFAWAKVTINSSTQTAGNYVTATFNQYSEVPY